jgi:membrane-bound ClpP family serine protease
MFNGERWAAKSLQTVRKGQKLRVKSIKGLTLNLASSETTENDKEQANANPT